MKEHHIHLTDAELDALPAEERELAWRLIRGQRQPEDIPPPGRRLVPSFTQDPAVNAASQRRPDGSLQVGDLFHAPKRGTQ